jgi:uncharacterized protein YcsI (UPF0317 family)
MNANINIFEKINISDFINFYNRKTYYFNKLSLKDFEVDKNIFLLKKKNKINVSNFFIDYCIKNKIYIIEYEVEFTHRILWESDYVTEEYGCKFIILNYVNL